MGTNVTLPSLPPPSSPLTFDGEDGDCRVLIYAVGRCTPVYSAVAHGRDLYHEPRPLVRHPHSALLGDRKFVAIPRDQQVRRATGVGRRVARERDVIRRRRHHDGRWRWHYPRTIWNTPRYHHNKWLRIADKAHAQFIVFLSLTFVQKIMLMIHAITWFNDTRQKGMVYHCAVHSVLAIVNALTVMAATDYTNWKPVTD